MSVRRHTTYNVLGAALPFAVSLLTVPAYLHQVGEARFGILSIVWLLLGYFGLFDLGLGMATAQRIAARHNEGRGAQARIFWTALLTNLALGVLGGLLAWPAATYYFGHSLKVDEALRAEMISAIPWLILAVPVATVTGVASGALQGLHRFARLNIISVIGAVLFQLVPLAAALFWSPALTVVLPVSLAMQGVTLALLGFECHRALLRGESASYDRSELRVLFRFGFWVTVSAFFTPFVTMVDRFILGAYISAASVSVYAVPFNLGQRLCILGNSAGVALFPRFSSAGKEEALRLGAESERMIAAIMLVTTVSAIFLVGPFLSVWIGHDFARRATGVGQIIMVGVWLEAVSRVPLYGLRGQSRPEAIAWIDLIQLVPFWIALYFLITNFGVEGVAVAYVLRCLMNYFLLAREYGTFARVKLVMILGFALLVASLVLASNSAPLSMMWLAGLIASLAAGLAFAWFALPNGARKEIARRFPLGWSA
jgi:O-antigen/teichoic acid export membrane protein